MAERSSDENVVLQGPIMNIPNELVYDIATRLPLKMLFRLALVCTRWRALLLSCPELWTRIHIAFGHCFSDKERPIRPDLWEPLLGAFFARSQDLPVVVDIQVGDDFKFGDADCEEVVAVSDLLRDNMHRVKSLSMSFRFTARHPSVSTSFLRTRAPVLRTLCLRVRSFRTADALVIGELFSGHAPQLERVELNGLISIVGRPLLALPGITDFCFKRREWERHPNAVLQDLLKQLPALQRLTLDSTHPFALDPPCLQPLDLQIRVPRKWDASDSFPHARSICCALGGVRGNSDEAGVSAANLDAVLQRYTQTPVTALETRLGPLVVPAVGSDSSSIGMTVKIDGEYAAVDADWIRHSRLVASTLYLHDLERLVLHEGNWDDFMDLELPRLRELTVYLRRALEWWPLKRPTSQRRPWALAVLRLAHMASLEQEAGARLTLKAEDVATLITRSFDPLALETIALRGCELSGLGIAELRALSPQAQMLCEEPSECDWVQPGGWPTSFVESGAMVV